ncbi:MAG: hypothetical protein U0401_08485 [Anaerolineae bacterium]
MNPRILYTAFDVVPSPKGASTHITYFTQGLVAAGYEVTLITAGTAALPDRKFTPELPCCAPRPAMTPTF